MSKQLRPYQLEDIEFLASKDTAGCFNEQRTGKTPTILQVLDKRGCTKNLIVCPASAIYQWADEYEYWLGKPCIVMEGTPTQRKKLLSQWTHGLIISYDTLKETKRSSGLVAEILQHKPDAIVADEAHRFKDTKSANARAMFNCMKIKTRYALTGTPAPGKQHEVYAILYFLFPSIFPSYWKFIEEYFVKNINTNNYGQRYVEIGPFQTGKRLQLQQFLNKHCTNRKRKDVMPWLPEKDYERVRLPATPEQKKYLEELSTYYETEHVIAQGVLDRLIRYRQICLHPALVGLKGASPKVNYIKSYMQDYPETPTLIFSKFTSFIKILQDNLPKEKVGVIVGETPKKEREQLRQNFQSGKLNMLLINIDAGKEALTLDRAEAAIFTDIYPPASDIQQAEDRGVATTEDKKDKPYKIIKLMIKGTYDERLHELLAKRASETDIINDYKKYLRGGN